MRGEGGWISVRCASALFISGKEARGDGEMGWRDGGGGGGGLGGGIDGGAGMRVGVPARSSSNPGEDVKRTAIVGDGVDGRGVRGRGFEVRGEFEGPVLGLFCALGAVRGVGLPLGSLVVSREDVEGTAVVGDGGTGGGVQDLRSNISLPSPSLPTPSPKLTPSTQPKLGPSPTTLLLSPPDQQISTPSPSDTSRYWISSVSFPFPFPLPLPSSTPSSSFRVSSCTVFPASCTRSTAISVSTAA